MGKKPIVVVAINVAPIITTTSLGAGGKTFSIKEKEIKIRLAYFLVRYNLPFSLSSPLLRLIKKKICLKKNLAVQNIIMNKSSTRKIIVDCLAKSVINRAL